MKKRLSDRFKKNDVLALNETPDNFACRSHSMFFYP